MSMPEKNVQHADGFEEWFKSVDSACEEICQVAAIGGYWSDESYTPIWIEFFNRIANMRAEKTLEQWGGQEALLPLHLALVQFGVTALQSGNLKLLADVLHSGQVPYGGHGLTYVPFLIGLRYGWGDPGAYFQGFKHHSTKSGHLSHLIVHSRLYDRSAPFFVSRQFWIDRYLALEALLALEIVISQVETAEELGRGVWAPTGWWEHNYPPVSGSRFSAVAHLMEAIALEGSESKIVMAGFGKNAELAVAALAAIRDGRVSRS
jgi:hypothetical protein